MCPIERLLDVAGHRRSPVTMPGYHQGRPPKNKGLRFPADPPTVEEIIAVMSATGNGADGARLRALIIVLWRAGLRISEALDLAETDLDRSPRCCRGARREGRPASRGRHGPLGVGSVDLVPGDSRVPACRGAVLCHPRPHRREALGGLRGAQAAASNGGSGGRPSALCASSVGAGPRCRARPRGRPAGSHPAAARALQFGGHQHLPPGNRQLGDHRDGSFPARTGDLSDIRPAPTLGSNRLLICRGRPARGRHPPPVHLRAGAHARCRASPPVAKLREARAVICGRRLPSVERKARLLLGREKWRGASNAGQIDHPRPGVLHRRASGRRHARASCRALHLERAAMPAALREGGDNGRRWTCT
jgi:hypothetical protein